MPKLLKERADGLAYRIYMAECARIVTENTARFSGGERLTVKYHDIISPKKQDTRSCEEITADVVKRCGLVVKHESI